jgi:methylmalonyl-CoA mutase C-terminal domain/subunit
MGRIQGHIIFMTQRKLRILVSKLGLDGHDRGAKLVAHSLKHAGFDVIYLGIRHTIPEVVDLAVKEEVDYLGLSFLSGDHMTLVPKVIKEVRGRNAENIRIIVGGIILRSQVPELKAMGVQQVFLPGTPLTEIETYIKENT